MYFKIKNLSAIIVTLLYLTILIGCTNTATDFPNVPASSADTSDFGGSARPEITPTPEEQRLLDEDKVRQALSGKYVSILGDSISTFPGYSNNTDHNSTIGDNALWYRGTNHITDVNETWWKQALDRTGTKLLVNNSWSGDAVTDRGIRRSLELHNNDGIYPDIIWVYMGANDFRTGVDIGYFAAKYDEMISGIIEKYPDAEIYLFTTFFTVDVHPGVNPNDVVYYNTVVEAVADKYGLALVDLYNDSGITKETLSKDACDRILHPNEQGMDKITECLIDVLIERYAK